MVYIDVASCDLNYLFKINNNNNNLASNRVPRSD